MCILYICRFKSHIIHIHKRRQASLKTRVLFAMVFVANGFLICFSPVIKCMDIGDSWVLTFNVAVLSIYFLFISTFSLVLCVRLLALMNFGNLKKRRSRLIKLEVLIQLTLAYNCLLSYKWDEEAATPVRIGIETGYYILSELTPFVAVAIAFFYQMGIYRGELEVDEPKADTGSTTAPDDEFRRFFIDHGIPVKEAQSRRSGSGVFKNPDRLSIHEPTSKLRLSERRSKNLSIQDDNEIERMFRRVSKTPISTEDACEQFDAFHRNTYTAHNEMSEDEAAKNLLYDGTSSYATLSTQKRG